MKKLLFLGISCLLFLYGCKKSDSKTSISIVGKWLHTKTILNSDQSGTLTPIETTNYSDSNNFAQFNSSGSGVTSKSEGSSYVTTNFTYTISGTKLSLTNGSDVENYTITLLSQNSLVIQSEPFSSGSQLQVSVDYFSK